MRAKPDIDPDRGWPVHRSSASSSAVEVGSADHAEFLGTFWSCRRLTPRSWTRYLRGAGFLSLRWLLYRRLLPRWPGWWRPAWKGQAPFCLTVIIENRRSKWRDHVNLRNISPRNRRFLASSRCTGCGGDLQAMPCL
jgi:hypothetical protein